MTAARASVPVGPARLDRPAQLDRAVRRARPARGANPAPAELTALLDQVSMVLQGGIAPSRAWAAVAAAQEAEAPKALAQRIALGAVPDGDDPHLRALALCLRISATSGAAASSLLLHLAGSLRDLADAERARDSAFAGPKATARILMALPLAALVLGFALGADPLSVLFGSPAGLGLLALGGTLTAAGWWWMLRLLHVARGTVPHVDPSIILDVLAAVIEAGSPLAHALRAVGRALGDKPPGPELVRAGLALEQGVAATVALSRLGGELASIRSTAILAHATGAQLAPLLRMQARDLRRSRARDAEAAAARLAVRLVLPTGVAILPAFVALGIVPIIIDLLTADLGLILGGG